MYAERALARGEDPEEVIHRIADFRSSEKERSFVLRPAYGKESHADMGRESADAISCVRESEQIDVGRSSLGKSSRTRGYHNHMADQQLLRRFAHPWGRSDKLCLFCFWGKQEWPRIKVQCG